MSDTLKLMCILAHPDDETLGPGGVIARYAAEGVEVHLITATRGENGWPGDPDGNPGPTALGEIREQELACAAGALGIHEVYLLGYIDGHLDQADPQEAIARIVPYLREVRPQVVLTFDPAGVYGHPDHIAISQLTLAAIVCAANPDYHTDGDQPPHSVSKLYYIAESETLLDAYQAALGDIIMPVDGQPRRPTGWKEWAITTRIAIGEFQEPVLKAVRCHVSQQINTVEYARMAERIGQAWNTRGFYRAFSLVNGGRAIEDDLFAGLRMAETSGES